MTNERSFPPYTYTPGATPHPISDPRGHAYGRRNEGLVVVDVSRVEECESYQHGLKLFRHGYYWEAHEEWEAAWHAVGRTGVVADYLKGLIKLAAVGVKVREGNGEGVRRHARRAAELFSAVAQATPGADQFAGQLLQHLVGAAQTLASSEDPCPGLDHGRPVVFWPDLLGRPAGL